MYSPEYQAGKTKIVGPAFTVKFAPKSDQVAPKLKGNYVRYQLGHFCGISFKGS
jgi:regulator of RNase E activity RraA